MKFKGSFSTKSGFFQLWLLLILILTGILLSSIVSLLLGLVTPQGISLNDPASLRSIQAISVISSFLLPALALAWLCSQSPSEYLSLKKVPSIKIQIYLLIGLFLLNPTISLTTLINKQLTFPPFLKSLELWMQAKEQEMETLVNLLINEVGIIAFISNILVIALLAALTEEFLFRGAIQRIIEKWTANYHIVIWTAAIVFSAIHLQFYGFVPRMLLGAYFGYLLYWTKSIWAPVLAHFINNAVAVIASRNEEIRQNEFISGDIKSEHLIGFSILSVFTLFLFFLLCKKLKRETESQN